MGSTGTSRANWANLVWKTLLVVAIVLLMSLGDPLSWFVAWGFLNPIPATLLLWGFLLVGIAANNLFEGEARSRLALTLLAVAAYGVLTVPGVLVGPERTVDVIGPVTALTLAAQLVRRDLPRALRDWALVMGIALYASLGVQAMWLVANSFANKIGPLVVLVLLPPLVFEAVLLIMRRVGRVGSSLVVSVVSLALATALGVIVFSLTMFNVDTDPLWRVIFGLLLGILIGGALLIGLLTRPLVFAASGSLEARANAPARGINLARTLVELSHDPILIALALYIPLRLIPHL
jgi:hypothetical protein